MTTLHLRVPAAARWLLAGAVAALAGCAAQLPPAISEAPPGSPGVAEVRAAPEGHRGAAVRWGGTLAEVRNRAEVTELEIVARPLAGSGRPREGDGSEGRFIARVPGFLDPAIHARGRLITVAGRVAGVRRGTVGEYPYRFPVVEASAHHLWEPLPDPPRAAPCWYDPWYPFGCSPYHWRHRGFWPYTYW